MTKSRCILHRDSVGAADTQDGTTLTNSRTL
jgi:hypothetical protein